MLKRATWFFAAGCVLLALMLAAVAYGWWHLQRDKAREATLKAAYEAVAVAKSERDAARVESRRTDSLARVRADERDVEEARADGLQARLAALAHQQPTGTFESVPAGEEPLGITWRDAFFVADSGWISTQAALHAEQQRSKLFLTDRDRWKHVAETDSVAMLKQATAIDVVSTKNDCHLLWVIACPSRKAMFVTGVLAGTATTLILSKPWEKKQPADTLRTTRRAGFVIHF